LTLQALHKHIIISDGKFQSCTKNAVGYRQSSAVLKTTSGMDELDETNNEKLAQSWKNFASGDR